MSELAAPQRPTIAVGSVRSGYISFVGQLNSVESLSGTPTVVEVSTSDLTISSVAVTSSAAEIDGESVPAGKAVQFSIQGAQAGVTYKLKVTVSTNSTPSQDLIGYAYFTAEC